MKPGLTTEQERRTQTVPQGWKLVPVEPTKEMLDATSWPGCAKTNYRHMLAAAPPPPVKRPYAQGTALGELGVIPMCDQVGE